jgi:DNA-binding CsgD family transcriptional regulator
VGAIAQSHDKGFLKLGSDWLCKAKLWDIVDSAINSDSITVSPVFNKVDQRCVLEATSPMVIEQIIIKVLQELSKVDSLEGVTVRSMKQAGAGNAPASYALSFLTKSKKLIGKGSSSLLTASGLRLKKNCQTLAAAIGIELSSPKLFHHDQIIEAQLAIPGRLKRTVDGHGLGDSPKLANLSSREREIVVMVRVGYDNEEISKSLGITHATVKQHLKAIYKKTSVKNRIQLIFMDLDEAV